jgi:hypothetical protein
MVMAVLATVVANPAICTERNQATASPKINSNKKTADAIQSISGFFIG